MDIEERAIRIAQYIVENDATIRAAARKFGVGKTTVHDDVTKRLPEFHPLLAAQARWLSTKPTGTTAAEWRRRRNTLRRHKRKHPDSKESGYCFWVR